MFTVLYTFQINRFSDRKSVIPFQMSVKILVTWVWSVQYQIDPIDRSSGNINFGDGCWWPIFCWKCHQHDGKKNKKIILLPPIVSKWGNHKVSSISFAWEIPCYLQFAYGSAVDRDCEISMSYRCCIETSHYEREKEK